MNRPTGEVLDGLATLIDSTNPDVVCLQEFKGYVGKARDRFGGNWFIYAHNDWAESNDNPVMVRKAGHEQAERDTKNGWDTLRTTTDWTGPQGGTHHGRTWTWVKVSGVWVLSFHRCTGGKDRNQRAFMEEYDTVVTWIGNHTPCLVIGDHNCGKSATFPGASKLIAQEVGGSLSGHPEADIDYAIQTGVKGSLDVKGSQGSDHRAIIWKRT